MPPNSSIFYSNHKGGNNITSFCCFWIVGCFLLLLFFFMFSFQSRNSNIFDKTNGLEIVSDRDISYGATSEQIPANAPLLTAESLTNKKIAKYRRKWAGNGINIDDLEFQNKTEGWKEKLFRKLVCLRMKKASIYMYHVRRAAGTTVRDVLHKVALRWGARYHETEGPVLNEKFLSLPGLLTITTLRDPVRRVSSLYWSEHVGWFDGILRQPEKCKSYREWVDAWRDDSEWKNEFVASNPGNLYVEVENYYVKALTGWMGNTTIGRKDLEKAKKVLESFDLVFLSDWMYDDTQVDSMNALFPVRQTVDYDSKVRGNYYQRVKLTPVLAADEEEVNKIVREINQFDVELFDYAQSLMAYRLKLVHTVLRKMKTVLGISQLSRGSSDRTNYKFTLPVDMCPADTEQIIRDSLVLYLGVFRPPKHKGPME